jgi:hypothetical protein
MNFGSHIIINPLKVTYIPAWKCCQERREQVLQNSYGNDFFSGRKLPIFDVLLREQKFNQEHFLAMFAPELSTDNPDA